MRDVHTLPLVGLQVPAARADHPAPDRPGPLLDTVMMVSSEVNMDLKFITCFSDIFSDHNWGWDDISHIIAVLKAIVFHASCIGNIHTSTIYFIFSLYNS